MPRFFKRSAKVAIANQQNDNDNAETCAIDTYRLRSCDQPLDFANQNRLIENELNAERLTGSTTSVGERVSNFVNGIFGKMGRNRRKSINKINQQPIQQQPQSHLKKVHLQGEKQQSQHGKIQRQPSIKKGHHNEFYSNETAIENNKSAPVPFDTVNIKKSEHGPLNGGGRGVGGGYDEKLHRNLHDSKNNIKNHHNAKFLHTDGDTFNTNESERVICMNRNESASNHTISAANCNTANAADHHAKVCNQRNGVDAVVNIGIANATAAPNEIDRMLDDRVNKNSLFAAETTTLHSCIEIDFSIETNSDRSECKQSTVENNNKHISSSADSNNNEVNIVAEISNDVHSDAVVNCESDNSNAIHSDVGAVLSTQPLEDLQKSSHDTVAKIESKQAIPTPSKRSQLPVCNIKNGTRTMGQSQSQSQSTNPTVKTNPKPNNNTTNSTKCVNEMSESKASDPTPKFWHDAAQAPATAAAVTAQAPHYDKNKNNFSNEINEILETKTSPKQPYREPEPGAEKSHSDAVSEETANEIKDVFYETSSELNVDEIKSPVFASDGESVKTSQYIGSVTENVNGGSVARSSFETNSNGTINGHKIDTEIPLKNDKIDVTSTTNCDTVTATAAAQATTSLKTTTATATTTTATKPATNVPSSENQNHREERGVKNVQSKNNFIGTNEKIEIQRDCKSECGATNREPFAHLKQNREQSEQMEQNVLYRVDSYTSDDALELSDIEETVIDQNGKVIEVKTLFKQRPNVKTPSHEVQFKKSGNNVIDGVRTINSRRRSNSISSLGIEIVEVGAATTTNHTDFLTQQPFVSFGDESNAIKLSDLRDNTKEIETEIGHAIDIVEIVEESESGSEYEEIEEEIEEEVLYCVYYLEKNKIVDDFLKYF